MDLNNESEELYECQMSCPCLAVKSTDFGDQVGHGMDRWQHFIPSLQWLQLMKLEMIFLSKRITEWREPSEFTQVIIQLLVIIVQQELENILLLIHYFTSIVHPSIFLILFSCKRSGKNRSATHLFSNTWLRLCSPNFPIWHINVNLGN